MSKKATEPEVETKPKTAKPSKLREEEVFIHLTRAQALLSRAIEALFKGHRLTPATYNILRILRGSGPDGLPCSQISERMLTAVPDVTRLIDRLVRLGLVVRYRTETDRRLVFQRLTPQGYALLAEMDSPLRQIHRDQLGHLSIDELETLENLLLRCREKVEP